MDRKFFFSFVSLILLFAFCFLFISICIYSTINIPPRIPLTSHLLTVQPLDAYAYNCRYLYINDHFKREVKDNQNKRQEARESPPLNPDTNPENKLKPG